MLAPASFQQVAFSQKLQIRFQNQLRNRTAARPLLLRRCRGDLTRLAARADRESAADDFQKLTEVWGIESAVQPRSGAHGVGLYTTRSVVRGEVLLAVPLAACLRFGREPDTQRTTELNLPPASWPRVRFALESHQEYGLPWDILAAVAIMDAAEGSDAGGAWSFYAERLLPEPGTLTLPLVMPDAALDALQHPEVARGARAQRERLKALLPEIAREGQPGAQEGPGRVPPGRTLEWAFACVRSRAFEIGENAFAVVPFADLANHDEKPSADVVRPVKEEGDDGFVRLVAREAMEAGREVTLSYSGADGYDNQRLMVQHGFVMAGGNRKDRVPIAVEDDFVNLDTPGAFGGKLLLEWMQRATGDDAWMEMILGNDNTLYAALKSIPCVDVPVPADGQRAAGGDGGSGAASTSGSIAGQAQSAVGLAGLDPCLVARAQAAVAASMLRGVRGQIQGFVTTVAQDKELLSRLESGSSASNGARGEDDGATTAAVAAAVRYRLERKLVWEAAERALSAFVAFTTALGGDSSGGAAGCSVISPAAELLAREAAKSAYSKAA